jgi:hypothetical protein
VKTDAKTPPVADSSLPPVVVSGQQIELPHVAKALNVVEFQPRLTAVTPIDARNTPATRGQKAVKVPREKGPVVEVVKASKGTWAFRLRWNSLPDRPVQYITRVDDRTYTLITSDKEMYERYKRQVLEIHGKSAIPTGDRPHSRSTGTL